MNFKCNLHITFCRPVNTLNKEKEGKRERKRDCREIDWKREIKP
jgi:hypothetical protein